MATQRESPRFVAVNRIRSERVQEFEELILAIAAAHEQSRPHLSGQAQILRSDTDADGNDASVYLFLFYGDVPFDEWDIQRACIETLGEEEGQRLVERFVDCLDGEQVVYAISGEVATA